MTSGTYRLFQLNIWGGATGKKYRNGLWNFKMGVRGGSEIKTGKGGGGNNTGGTWQVKNTERRQKILATVTYTKEYLLFHYFPMTFHKTS